MKRLTDLAAETAFDIVHADQHNMAQFALRVKNTPHLLDAHNVLWMLYKTNRRNDEPGTTTSFV